MRAITEVENEGIRRSTNTFYSLYIDVITYFHSMYQAPEWRRSLNTSTYTRSCTLYIGPYCDCRFLFDILSCRTDAPPEICVSTIGPCNGRCKLCRVPESCLGGGCSEGVWKGLRSKDLSDVDPWRDPNTQRLYHVSCLWDTETVVAGPTTSCGSLPIALAWT